ncbi:MBOAT family protein [Pandoraea pnomenusa]|uniref:MBOAT family O-acyltransferase n=1 Tax=Pandoraea pnomenusa TaxID=93220 RepID=UPI00119882F1|nr:MBOAT family protein [Pandoraea pnomenusa]QDX22116.1 MBOAT family protein [Pandoraea pnomenusa]
MLFTSPAFLFLFLPVVLLGFAAISKVMGMRFGAIWLALASLFFYGVWSVDYIPLLLGSIAFNYCVGFAISKARRKWLLWLGIGGDLALLGYFKYTNFFLGSIADLTGSVAHHYSIILPLGISFYTFTQIAFLVDAWQNKAREYNPWHYLLFVTWFPHLIAGPVLHHAPMMKQFRDPAVYRLHSKTLAFGFALFCIGLGKKLLIADPISHYVDPVFHLAGTGAAVGFVPAWSGALAYTFQLYFDFSGYSDMAVGLSMMFGIRLPINFDSPYKSVNISDFWRRWHMTLSQFLRDYLYIPLGGNRHGEARRLTNLMITMLLGGLWHGAAWTFVVWGGLHGIYLCVQHTFSKLVGDIRFPGARAASVLLTFLCVVVAWVFFRADNLHSAITILHGMAGGAGRGHWTEMYQGKDAWTFAWAVMACLAAVWFLPNSNQIVEWLFRENRHRVSKNMLQITAAIASVVIAALGVVSTFGATVHSPFLYFQF